MSVLAKVPRASRENKGPSAFAIGKYYHFWFRSPYKRSYEVDMIQFDIIEAKIEAISFFEAILIDQYFHQSSFVFSFDCLIALSWQE